MYFRRMVFLSHDIEPLGHLRRDAHELVELALIEWHNSPVTFSLGSDKLNDSHGFEHADVFCYGFARAEHELGDASNGNAAVVCYNDIDDVTAHGVAVNEFRDGGIECFRLCFHSIIIFNDRVRRRR